MFNITSSKDRGVFCSKEKNFLSYYKINKLIKNIVFKDKKKKLVFLLVENSVWSIVNYISLIKSSHIILLLDDKIKKYLLLKFIDNFKPDYIVSRSSLSKIILKKKFKLLEKDKSYYYKNLKKNKCNLNNSKILIPTSGSSGEPKTVMLTEKGLLNNSKSIIKLLNIKSSDRPIIYMPIFYSYGMSILNTHIKKNCSILVTDKSFLQKNFWDFLKKNKCTSFSGVPYTYEAIIKLQLYKLFNKELKYFTQAGGNLEVKKRKFLFNIIKKKNGKFNIMYGQTEASPRITILNHKDFIQNMNSVGKAIPGNKIYILDKNKSKVINKTGLIYNISKNNMLGYAKDLNDLQNKKNVIKELNTHDFGKINSRGYLTVYGRNDQEIKIRGHRINLNDLKLSINDIDVLILYIKNKIFIISENKIDNYQFFLKIKKKYNLNPQDFEFIKIKKIKYLPNNKIDINYFKKKINEKYA